MARTLSGGTPSPQPQMTQSQILARLGLSNIPWYELQNGRVQQAINMDAARHHLPQPFAPSAASALIQDLIPIGGIAAIGAAAGSGVEAGVETATSEGATAAETAGAGAAGAGAGAEAAGGGLAGGLFSKVLGAITSPLDFLLLLAWLFHPRNILRGVEFLVGIVLMIFGLHAAMQARGEKLEGFTTSESALTRSGLARVADSLGAAARGEGRRPASAPHVVRRQALAQRYTREQRVRERERKGEKPAGHAGKTKGSGAGTKPAKR